MKNNSVKDIIISKNIYLYKYITKIKFKPFILFRTISFISDAKKMIYHKI